VTTGAASAKWSVAGSGPAPADAADFTGGVLPSGLVNFAAGETSQTITVNAAGDTLVEAYEGFTITLANPNGATLATAKAAGTIVNDDYEIVSLLENGGFERGDFSGWTLNFTPPSKAALINPARVNEGIYAVNFNFVEVPASAVLSQKVTTLAGQDYTVSFDFGTVDLAGQTLSLKVEALGADRMTRLAHQTVQRNGNFSFVPPVWSDESFVFKADGAVVTLRITDTTANGDFADPLLDDVRIQGPGTTLAVTANSPSVAEGNSGTTPVVFTVTRSGDLSGTQSVGWSVVPAAGIAAPAFVGGNPLEFRGTVDQATGIMFFDRHETIQSNAVATQWQIYANQAAGQVQLLIYQDLGTTRKYIGGSGLETVTAAGVNTLHWQPRCRSGQTR